jgi:hypothetical protein
MLAVAIPAAADGVLEIGGTSDGVVAQSMEVASWSFGASPATGPVKGGRQAAAPVPAVGDVVTVTVRDRNAPTSSTTGPVNENARLAGDCVKGQHIKEAKLRIDGRVYVLSDLEVTACSASAGMRQRELRGHVTLIK